MTLLEFKPFHEVRAEQPSYPVLTIQVHEHYIEKLLEEHVVDRGELELRLRDYLAKARLHVLQKILTILREDLGITPCKLYAVAVTEEFARNVSELNEVCEYLRRLGSSLLDYTFYMTFRGDVYIELRMYELERSDIFGDIVLELRGFSVEEESEVEDLYNKVIEPVVNEITRRDFVIHETSRKILPVSMIVALEYKPRYGPAILDLVDHRFYVYASSAYMFIWDLMLHDRTLRRRYSSLINVEDYLYSLVCAYFEKRYEELRECRVSELWPIFDRALKRHLERMIERTSLRATRVGSRSSIELYSPRVSEMAALLHELRNDIRTVLEISRSARVYVASEEIRRRWLQ